MDFQFKSCKFEICCNEVFLNTRRLLDFGSISRVEKDDKNISLELRNPSMNEIIRLLDIMEEKNPVEEEDPIHTQTSLTSTSSFEVLHDDSNQFTSTHLFKKYAKEATTSLSDKRLPSMGDELENPMDYRCRYQAEEFCFLETSDEHQTLPNELKGKEQNSIHQTSFEILHSQDNARQKKVDKCNKTEEELDEKSKSHSLDFGQEKELRCDQQLKEGLEPQTKDTQSLCDKEVNAAGDDSTQGLQRPFDAEMKFLGEENCEEELREKFEANVSQTNESSELELEKEKGEGKQQGTEAANISQGVIITTGTDIVKQQSEALASTHGKVSHSDSQHEQKMREKDCNPNQDEQISKDIKSKRDVSQNENRDNERVRDYNDIKDTFQEHRSIDDPKMTSSFDSTKEDYWKSKTQHHNTDKYFVEGTVKAGCLPTEQCGFKEEKVIMKTQNVDDTNNVSPAINSDIDDDDDYESNNETRTFSTVIMKADEYKLALKLFADTNIYKSLQKAQKQNSLHLIEVEDQESVNRIKEFKKRIKRRRVSFNTGYMILKNAFFFSKVILVETENYHFLLTTADIHDNIDTFFQDLDNNEESPTTLKESSSKNETSSAKKGDSNEEDREPPSSQLQSSIQKKNTSAKREHLTTLNFKDKEYEIALTFFEETPALYNCIKKARKQDSSWNIQVMDEEILKSLQNFKNQLSEVRVSRDKYAKVMEVKNVWGPKIIDSHHRDYISVFTHEFFHREIRIKFPQIYMQNSISPSLPESNLKTGYGGNEGTLAGGVEGEENMDCDETEVDEVPKASSSLRDLDGPDSLRKSQGVAIFKSRHSKLIVKVYKANITELPVDVIVNAANGKLHHAGGVARAIADAAGQKLNDECRKHAENNPRIEVSYHFVSTGGNLKAKKVYHAVGPKWSNYRDKKEDKCKQDLRLTILRCLIHAELDLQSSIAFPSISSAIFKVPKEICVESYMKAVQHFDQMRSKYYFCSLQEVHFVDIDDNMVNVIKEKFISHWERPIDNSSFNLDNKKIEEYYKSNKSDAARHSERKVGEADAVRHFAEKKVRETDKASHHKREARETEEAREREARKAEEARRHEREEAEEARRHEREEAEEGRRHERKARKAEEAIHSAKNFTYADAARPPAHGSKKYNKSSSASGVTASGRINGTMRVMTKSDNHYIYYEIYYQMYSDEKLALTQTAFIPYTEKGHKAVRLLLLAFHRGLTFKSSGTSYGIEWNGIPHKTIFIHFQSDYPDYDYLSQLFKSLRWKNLMFETMNFYEKQYIDSWMDQLFSHHVIIHFNQSGETQI